MVLLILHQQAVKQVDVADELAHQPTGRGFVDVHRAADLLDATEVHDGDPLGHGHGFFLIVGHHDAGHADPLDDLDQLELHGGAQLLVERPMGSSSSSSLGRLAGNGPGPPLTLTTGELVRLAAGVLGHLHQLEHLFHPGIDLRLWAGHPA